MLSLQALDQVRHRFHASGEIDLHAEAEPLDQAWRQASRAEIVLRRLARHRTGRDDVAKAFAADELGRLRPLLLAAGQAHGRITRSVRPVS